jgi:hypothetical protein
MDEENILNKKKKYENGRINGDECRIARKTGGKRKNNRAATVRYLSQKREGKRSE